jgi:hypothetical protein
MLKVWYKSKMFLHFQSIQTLSIDSPCFFQTFCAPFSLKIEDNFNIDDQKG